MSTDKHSTWVLDTLRSVADEVPQARIRLLNEENRTRTSVRVPLPVTGRHIAKAAEVADAAVPGDTIRVDLLDDKGAYVRGTQRRLEALVPVDSLGQLAGAVVQGLESSAPLPGSKGAQIADVQASHMPLLAMERMTRTLADALVRVDASYSRREDRLMSLVEASNSGLKQVALGRATGDAEVWRELVEARSDAAALAAMASEEEDSGSGLDMTQLQGVIKGVASIGDLKSGAKTGQLLQSIVVQLSEGKGLASLKTAIDGLSAERRQALAGHLIPLFQ